MFWRYFFLAFCQLVPVALVWNLMDVQEQPLALLLASLAGAFLWLTLDVVWGLRLLHWLRSGDMQQPSPGRGLWTEVADRVRRLVRTHERQVAESELRLQEFLAAIQASPNGVVLLDAEGRIEWFNQTAATHFGLDAERDLLQHFGNLVRNPVFAAYYASRNFDHEVHMEGREHQASAQRSLSVHLHPYGAGRSLLLSRDVTALEQAEAMRRDFVANVSHEIRTPLTVLAGFVETLQTLPLGDADRSRYLGLMAQQAQRMQSLVNDLLTLSRLEGSPPPPAHEWVAVAPLMAQCEQDAHDLSVLLWGVAQRLQFQFDPGLELAGSATELHSAMSNLIGNAVRYSPADKTITVHLGIHANGSATFSVKDEGQGIAAEHIPRLTERFYRVDRSRSRETGGTGLGLAIVKHVAQRHGATLVIESTPGKGSRFVIAFPALRVRQRQAALSAA